MDNLNIDFQNVFANDFNMILFSIIGMSIVFTGLALISTYIALLPKLLDLLHKKPKGSKTTLKGKASTKSNSLTTQQSEVDLQDEIVIAIATALHLEQTHLDENLKITWPRESRTYSPWHTAGKNHALALRSNIVKRK